MVTNLEKMNELTKSNADKKKIINWAYMNRIQVIELALNDPLETMKNSVEDFYKSEEFMNHIGDEFKLWDIFLDREYVE